MKTTKSKIIYLIMGILALAIGFFCGGCALKMNDIETIDKNGVRTTDKSFHFGTNDFSTGKEINLLKVN